MLLSFPLLSSVASPAVSDCKFPGAETCCHTWAVITLTRPLRLGWGGLGALLQALLVSNGGGWYQGKVPKGAWKGAKMYCLMEHLI